MPKRYVFTLYLKFDTQLTIVNQIPINLFPKGSKKKTDLKIGTDWLQSVYFGLRNTWRD